MTALPCQEDSGPELALYDKRRPGAATVLEGSQQRIIAMVCSDPPEGRARWTVRQVAEEAVKRPEPSNASPSDPYST